MKKTYVKPFASFESFELSSSIAGTCVTKTGHAVNECGLADGTMLGVVFFNVGTVTQCTHSPQDGDPNKGCYQGPSGNLFTS